ncbi:Uncharacterised protein [Shigella sonnei]|nr:Uncharacterised protein [Shigella sonnei]
MPLQIAVNNSLRFRRSIKGLTIAGISFCPRKMVVTATNDSILLIFKAFWKIPPRMRIKIPITPM